MQRTHLAVALALLAALFGGSYAAKRLLEGGASNTYCPRNAAGWVGRVTGPRPRATRPVRERRIAKLINGFRRSQHLPTLRFDARLSAAARAHSLDMIERGYFAHDGPHGRTFTKRLARYTPQTCLAENIAWGTGKFGTASQVVEGWKHSSGHRHVMLLPWVRRVGVGVRDGAFSGQSRASVATADFSG